MILNECALGGSVSVHFVVVLVGVFLFNPFAWVLIIFPQSSLMRSLLRGVVLSCCLVVIYADDGVSITWPKDNLPL